MKRSGMAFRGFGVPGIRTTLPNLPAAPRGYKGLVWAPLEQLTVFLTEVGLS